jgi:hypothetical protein
VPAPDKKEEEKQGEEKIVEEKASDDSAEVATVPEHATNEAEQKLDEKKS